MDLNKKACGLALGIIWGVTLFLATIWIIIKGDGNTLIKLQQFYIGYSISWLGAFIGLIYGFIDGFIGGWVFAWLYNIFARKKSE
ncbi:bacteriophage holin [Patescibacteria group bacterium AH-259-L07]|nr:bacteriophage holin [Patescibacteria group bacterium AH-259-L07]